MTKVKDLENVLGKFYEKNISKGKAFVANHFISLGIPKATAYRKIKRYEEGSLKRIVGSGRIAKIATGINIKKIAAIFNLKAGCSQRGVAEKFNCSQQYVSYILRNKTDVKARKKTRRPDRTLNQKKTMRPKCRKLYNQFKDYDFIMDDESYFTLSNSSLSGNDIYYADDPSKCADEVRYKLEKKYEEQLLVSICISPAGISPIYIHHSKQAVNRFVYVDILKNTLLPLVSNYYKKNKNFIFWPDLASAHYSAYTLEFLKKQKIKFVPKELNPANVPEARPIENFWGDLKRLVYKGNWIAKDIAELEKRIRCCYSKMNNDIYLDQIKRCAQKLNSIARNGL